jgi:3-hydroxyacyl-[acyl-carrier-protein] dehydratase
VLPGDTVEYHMSRIARKKNMWWYQGRAMVAGRLVAEAKVGATLS